jgi:signal transduction histidine kinase
VLEEILAKDMKIEEFEVEHEFPGLGRKTMLLNARRIEPTDGMVSTILLAIADITKRKDAEQQLKDLNVTLERLVADRTVELERRAAQLQRLAHELSNAEEQERQRLAELLHDDLQQGLSLLAVRLSQIRDRCIQEPHIPTPLPEIDSLATLATECIEKARGLSRELYPSTLRQLGLVATLDVLARDVKEKYGLDVTVSAGPEGEPEDVSFRAPLYRSVSELLFNVHKHAQVDSARVEAFRRDGELWICVRDSGKGFDPSRMEAGFGLFNIQERINCLGGRVEIESSPGGGTCIALIVPGSTPKLSSETVPAAERKRGDRRKRML